ncbi:helix-turn-helix domain-containing protein [Mycolicibacterium nivoides]|uniref:helix-turn-helix domain-containing protein n=1 Tax=Mycolicibacterium nivoides TaxID=2487344 RepID=UPI000F5BA442|nr:helix-turn-helix domain-containing protein [Mycolicibacterium nivoides]
MTAATPLLSDEPDRLLVTRPEAARMLSLSVPEIDRLRLAGKLLAKKHGSKVLFPVKELERFANDLPWELDQ